MSTISIPGFTAERSLDHNPRSSVMASQLKWSNALDALTVIPAIETRCHYSDKGKFCCYWSNLGEFLGCTIGYLN